MGPTDLIRLTVLWLSSRTNRQRVSGARVQACVFVVTNNPGPSILMVRSVYDEWSVPQEGVMIDESVPAAAWRGLDEEVGIRIDDPGGERKIATQRDSRYLGTVALPENRHGERPIADNVSDSPLGLIKMRAKAYWGVFLVIRSQRDLVAAPNEREVDAAEWCSFEEARRRVSGTVRGPKAELIEEGISIAAGHLPERRLPDRWQPADFVVHGQYCGAHQIVEELEEIRATWEARALILIVFREDTFFRPLLRLAHEDQGLVTSLQKTLSAETGFDRFTHDPQPTPHSEEDLLKSLPLKGLGLDEIEPAILSRLGQGTPRSVEDRPRPVSRPASFRLVVFGGNPPPVESEALSRLQLMVNCSAPVIAHRELEAQMDLRKALNVSERTWRERRGTAEWRGSAEAELPTYSTSSRDDTGGAEDHSYQKMLLELALKLTRSSVGNIYLANRESGSLLLEKQVGNQNAIGEITPVQRGRSKKVVLPGVVGRVFERGRALIINDVADYQRANSHADFLSVVAEDQLPYAELAVPIEQGPFASSVSPMVEAPKSEPIGVLNVERILPQDSAAGDFTPTDLATLQTIAHLYALRRAGNLTAFSADSLASLTEATALNPRSEVGSEPPDDPLTEVPVDMLSAQPTLAHIAKRIYELTRSHSVTIRVVTRDQLCLTRFVSEPSARLSDDDKTIRIDDPESVNAWVARSGKPSYIPNMLNHPTKPFPGLLGVKRIAQRHGIRSALCLPIKAHGRLVGTLNLESQHRSDYPDDVAAVVGALAQQVGLAISQARRNDERRLFSYQARQAGQAHQVLGLVDDLERLVENNEELRGTQASAEIDGLIRSIRRASDPELSRPFDVEPVGWGLTAAAGVIEDLLGKPRNKGHVFVRGDLPSGDLMLPELVSQVLTLAGDELLRNALRVTLQNRSVPFEVKARFDAVERAGRSYLRAEIVNPIRTPLRPEFVRRLYRGPIRSFDRTHIGAFVVGSFVRSVGGEVYVQENGPEYFGVRLEVPMDGAPAVAGHEGKTP